MVLLLEVGLGLFVLVSLYAALFDLDRGANRGGLGVGEETGTKRPGTALR